jgi:hypothetical protein
MKLKQNPILEGHPFHPLTTIIHTQQPLNNNLNEFKYHETEFGLVNMHNIDIFKNPLKKMIHFDWRITMIWGMTYN